MMMKATTTFAMATTTNGKKRGVLFAAFIKNILFVGTFVEDKGNVVAVHEPGSLPKVRPKLDMLIEVQS